MTNDFIQFYKDVIDSIGAIKYTDDGFIYVPEEDGRKTLININGKMLVLPTKDNISSLVVKKDDGSLEVTKVLFNPLKESVNRGNSVSLSRVKNWIEKKLSFNLACVGEMLLILASDKRMQKDTGLEINKFLSSITEAMNNNIKEIVDATSREKWAALYKKTFEKDSSFLTLFINKLYKIEGEKYNRATILGSDVYSELLKASKDKPVVGVNLRNKDITVFKLIFEYLLDGLSKDNETIAIGSNDNECAAFISLLKMYIKIGNRINKIGELIKFVNGEIYDAFYNEIKITIDDLDNIERFKSQYVIVPDEHEAERYNNTPQSTTSSVVNNKPQIQATHNIPTMNVQRPAQSQYVEPEPVKPEPVVPYNEPLTTTEQIQATSNSGAAAALQYLNNKNRNNHISYGSSHGGLRGANAVMQPQPPRYGVPPAPQPQVYRPVQPTISYQPPVQHTPSVGGYVNVRGNTGYGTNNYAPLENVQFQPYYNNSTVSLQGVRTSFPR